MKGDFSRQTFDPRKHYKGVRMQQGRVQLDADWNENLDILTYRVETETIDVIGRAGVPEHDAGFGVYPIAADIPADQQPDTTKYALNGSSDFWLTRGRAYVDGILCEIDETLPFSKQPHVLPDAAPVFSGSGYYLAYLDVWQRHITALDDPAIREVALGGPDTATRLQTVWQVKWLKVGEANANLSCASQLANWPPKSSTGRLSARAQPGDPADDPCSVPTGGGYRRLENQLYRVEVHKASGETGGPTFKWSRDNGSVVVAVDEFNVGGDAGKVKVASLGRDDVLGLHKFDYVEVSDDVTDLSGKPGTIAQITDIDPEDLVLTLSAAVPGYSTQLHAKVRRWDSPGEVPISVPATNDGYMLLEDGVEVKFELTTAGGDASHFRSGDYWLIPARTVPGQFGDIEWPKTPASQPVALLPQGIVHHYMKLAMVTVSGGAGGALGITEVQDCRKKFPPLTELPLGQEGCCSVTVGPEGDFPDLQPALDARPAEAAYWHVCLMPGEHRLEKTAVVNNMDGLTISGCYGQSHLIGKEGEPLLHVLNSRNVLIESLMIQASTDSYALLFLNSGFLRIANCQAFNAGKFEGKLSYYSPEMFNVSSAAGPMLVMVGCKEVEVRDNRMVGLPSLVAMATHLQVYHNKFSGGGVQVLPGSANVTIEDNQILKGFGPGVQLGGDPSIWEELLQQAKAETLKAKEAGIEETAYVNQPVEGKAYHTIAEGSYTRLSENRTLQIVRATQLVQVSNNLIAQMSGSGVVTALDFQADNQLGDVEMLSITHNRIYSCATQPDFIISDQSSVGGGIVLTGVSGVHIAHNLVLNNGSRSAPACGIFILDGSDIEIESNVVQENGIETYESEPTVFQAGIAALAVMGNNLGFQDLLKASTSGARTGLPALRVHDNQVVTPAGHALAVLALGTVSVQGNTFAARTPRRQPALLGPWSALMDIGKCVAILNFGQASWTAGLPSAFAVGIHTDVKSAAVSAQANRIPDGKVVFNDNQVSLSYETLPPDTDTPAPLPSSVFIYTLDDASLNANQINSDPRPAGILGDVLVGGLTVRASGNIFTEPAGYGLLSYISAGQSMNTTMGNQAVHCIVTSGAKKIETGNLVMQTQLCELLKGILGG